MPGAGEIDRSGMFGGGPGSAPGERRCIGRGGPGACIVTGIEDEECTGRYRGSAVAEMRGSRRRSQHGAIIEDTVYRMTWRGLRPEIRDEKWRNDQEAAMLR